MTAEFMADLAHCLAEKGGVVFNLAGHSDVRFEAALCSYVKTVNTVWPNVLLFHQGKRGLCNLIIIASADSLESYQPAKIPIPMSLERDVQQMLVPRPLKKQQLEAAQTLTDNSNVASVQYAWFYLQTRTRALSRLPPLLLVN